MSDHPKEAERNMKRIFICDDIYFDVFYWLSPTKIGMELALVSDRFDALVDTHFKSRKWTIGNLRIWSNYIDKLNDNLSTEKTLPFPQKPLPNSIVGFASVYIFVFDSDAIAFLRCISLLFVSNICLGLEIYEELNWNIFATSIWPLLNASAIIQLCFTHSFDFQHFRGYISPSILCDCSNLRMISFDYDQFLQFPPDDSKGSSDGQALCKWLLTPRADGQPKVFKFWLDGNEIPMDALKTTFLNATTSVSFIIRLYSFTSVGPFELVNSLTREQLTSRQIANDDDDDEWWLIERSPIAKNAKQWAKWEKEALENGANDGKVLRIQNVSLG